jgi:HSP20 family protein
MAKISKKPGRDFVPIEFGSFGRLFGIADEMDFTSGDTVTHIPEVDIYSTPTELLIEVEMPGVKKEDIDVYIHNDHLTVKALKYECFDDSKLNYVCMERVFGRLYRSVEIPCTVDTSKIKATYSDGVLTITLPRIENDKRRQTKRVPIESS